MKLSLTLNKAEYEATLAAFRTLEVEGGALNSAAIKFRAAIERGKNPKPLPLVLVPMTYYIAEVSFRASNPIHRCIAFHRMGGNLELLGSYNTEDMPVEKHINNLAYFRPIKALTEMDIECKAFLPKDAPIIIYIEK